MSISNGYCTLSEIRGEIGITNASDTLDDSRLEAAVEAASRAIDNETGRCFALASTATARYYTADDDDLLRVDDIGSLTDLAVATDDSGARTYATIWTATDYDVEPDNALAMGKPVTSLRVAPTGTKWFVRQRRGVKVTAKWGWPSVPADIRAACRIQAIRLYKRRDAPFGQTGAPEIGVMNLPPLDPDVKRLIAPYRKMAIGGA